MSGRKMITVTVIHDGGWNEEMVTDDPELLGKWLLYTSHKMPERERSLQGNWVVRAWTLPDA